MLRVRTLYGALWAASAMSMQPAARGHIGSEDRNGGLDPRFVGNHIRSKTLECRRRGGSYLKDGRGNCGLIAKEMLEGAVAVLQMRQHGMLRDHIRVRGGV